MSTLPAPHRTFRPMRRLPKTGRGFAATFMSKTYGDRAGSGFHVHFSLLDRNGVNVFDDGTEAGSDIMRYAVAGLLAAMPESTLLFAPHMNSYRRLRPGSHAPSAVAWGYENRTAAIRIPGGSLKARRIEHRVAGSDANPYLVLAGIPMLSAFPAVRRAGPPPWPPSSKGRSFRISCLRRCSACSSIASVRRWRSSLNVSPTSSTTHIWKQSDGRQTRKLCRRRQSHPQLLCGIR